MNEVPPGLRYAKSHEWLKLESDGTATVGITDYAQSSLGDITFAQLPKVGAKLRAGEAMGVIESVKAASDIYAPVAGRVVAVNDALVRAPETLNRSPYAEGWIARLAPDSPAEAEKLLDAAAYAKLTA